MPYLTCPVAFHLLGPKPAPRPWHFDLWSALIGAAVALLLAGLAYHFRDALRLGWETVVVEPLARLRHRLQASAEERYRELVAAWARSCVLPAHAAPLDAIFVEPELLPTPSHRSIPESEPVPGAPQTLPLSRILGGHSRLAILGTSGMGRTASLAYLALDYARAAGEERLPLYVPLPALDWGEPGEPDEPGEDEAGEESEWEDPVDRLIHAAVAAVGGGSRLAGPLRQRLKAGQAIVLADGWDELPPQQCQRAAMWLAELADAWPGNLYLVGAGRRGYAPLTEAGFVPLTLAPWDAGQVETFARRWMEACAPADAEPPLPLRRLVTELRRAARAGRSPLELTLQAFVYLTEGEAPAGRAALFERTLDLLLERMKEPWLPAVCRTVLEQVALNLQQEGRVTASREEIEAAIEAALPSPEERPARAAACVFHALIGEQGLLRPIGPNCYAFAHPLWQAYLVARQLAVVDPDTLIEHLHDPLWADVLLFYAELGDMEPLVAEWLRGPDDMFHTHLRALSSWISVAPEGAAWRDKALAALARGFLQRDQPLLARQALAEALAATGAPGVTYFFKQALQHPDIEVRVAAILGLARVAGEADLPTFEAALEDEAPAVREAAVRGLAYPGIDAATRLLEQILLAGDDTLRPVAARALARCGGEGAAFLRQAAESEDVMVRRAAVFGLALIEARDLLERMVREDEQWIVRSAASMALEELEKREGVAGVEPPPEVGQLSWLVSWAAAQGEGVGVGDAARKMLWRALREGDASVRLAAAQVLAQIGRPDDVEPLLAALTDPDRTVVDAAMEALAEISRRYDVRIEYRV